MFEFVNNWQNTAIIFVLLKISFVRKHIGMRANLNLNNVHILTLLFFSLKIFLK